MLHRLGARFRNGESVNKTSGCGIFGLIIGVLFLFSFLMRNPELWIALALVIVVIVVIVRESNKRKQAAFVDALEACAQILEGLGSGKEPEPAGGIALKKNEKLIYVLPMVALTEYTSSGSTYTGMNAGVSFPLFGNVRGNVGGMGGQILKNP